MDCFKNDGKKSKRISSFSERKRTIGRVLWRQMLIDGVYVKKPKAKVQLLKGQRKITDYFK
jgi:hypothetical protein